MISNKIIFRNFTSLFFSNIIGQLFFLFGTIRLARIFGPETFGIWGLGQAWLAYFFRLGEFGLEVVGIRAIARNSQFLSHTISDVVVLRLSIAVGLFALIPLFAGFGIFPKGSELLVLVFSLSLFPMSVILEWVFESQQVVGIVGIARIVKGFLFFVFIFFFIQNASQIIDSAYYYSLSIFFSTSLIVLAAIKRFKIFPLSFDFLRARTLFREALPIGLITLLSQYSLFAGTLLAGYLVDGDKLGYFTAGHRLIVFVWAYGITTSARVVLPQLTILHQSAHDQFVEFIKRYTRILGIAALLIGMTALIAGKEIVTICYGKEYEESINIFIILSGALMLGIIRSVIEVGLIASNKQAVIMRGMIGLAMVYSVLTILFTIVWGIQGCAIASVISESAYALYIFIVARFITLNQLVQSLWKPTLSAIVIVAGFIIIGIHSTIVTAMIAGVVYITSLYFLGEVSKEDFETVKALVFNGK